MFYFCPASNLWLVNEKAHIKQQSQKIHADTINLNWCKV